jgi:hypothetical protein
VKPRRLQRWNLEPLVAVPLFAASHPIAASDHVFLFINRGAFFMPHRTLILNQVFVPGNDFKKSALTTNRTEMSVFCASSSNSQIPFLSISGFHEERCLGMIIV